MCLMCEYYIDMCKEQECIAKAKDSWNLYSSREGWTAVLWRGYGEPCQHIQENRPEWRDDAEEDFVSEPWP